MPIPKHAFSILPGPVLRSLQAAALTLCLAGAANAAPPRLAPGDVPPDQVGKTLEGVPVKLSDHAGKVIVLSYWATWCGPCLKEIPILNGMQVVAGKEKMTVLGVNIERRDVFERVLDTVAKLDMRFAYDPDGAGRKAYGVDGIPHMVIIGRDGKIVQVHRGYKESMLGKIVDEINAALAAPLPEPVSATPDTATPATAAP